MWDYCGMARTAEGLTKAKGMLKQLREEFWKDVRVTGYIGIAQRLASSKLTYCLNLRSSGSIIGVVAGIATAEYGRFVVAHDNCFIRYMQLILK